MLDKPYNLLPFLNFFNLINIKHVGAHERSFVSLQLVCFELFDFINFVEFRPFLCNRVEKVSFWGLYFVLPELWSSDGRKQNALK